MARRSGGILAWRRPGSGAVGFDPAAIEVLLVHPGGPFWRNKDLGAWSIPKGELDEGEDPRSAALREFAEELGAVAVPELPDPDGLVDLGTVRQSGGKVVHAFAVELDVDPAVVESNLVEIRWPPKSERTVPVPEIDRAEWFNLAEARERINRAQAAFLDRLVRNVGGPRGSAEADDRSGSGAGDVRV